jgi:hypothetical protein
MNTIDYSYRYSYGRADLAVGLLDSVLLRALDAEDVTDDDYNHGAETDPNQGGHPR